MVLEDGPEAIPVKVECTLVNSKHLNGERF